MFEFLRKVPLFAGMSDQELAQMCQVIDEVEVPAGEELFSEGDLGDRAYVIQEGEIEIYKWSGKHKVRLAVTRTGEVIGEISLLEMTPRMASGRTLTDCRLIVIRKEQMDRILQSSPAVTLALLQTVVKRLKSTEMTLFKNEKMAQLGTLTAGIAHEINNPASAAQRGADQLSQTIERLQQAHLALSAYRLSPEQRTLLDSLDQLARQRAQEPISLGSLERSDRETETETWLEQHGIEDGWELAPILVNLGYQDEQLEQLAQLFTGEAFQIVTGWLEATFTVYSLLAEITFGAQRVGEIVQALKSYVYLDQGPVQPVNVHEGLDNTLVILRNKLRHKVSVHREYAPDLPRISAYGSELNQVWTNLIDNAIDAMETTEAKGSLEARGPDEMDGKGEITLRTRQEDDWVVVEIQDNGPGIPEDVLPHLFTPFYTSKPVGKGTGLGLSLSDNIIRKHRGEIRVTTQPGSTCFEVRLPVNFEEQRAGESERRQP